MNHNDSGLGHGTNGAPQLTLENGSAEETARNNEAEARGDVVFPEDESQIKHIFGDRLGHIPDTPENRTILLRLSRDPSKYLGKDKYGNSWHAEIMSNGAQYWVRYRDGIINEGGKNAIPRNWNSETGLNNNPVKRRKKHE